MTELGVRREKDETVFRLFSLHAERIELCVFPKEGGGERRVDLRRLTDGFWEARLGGVAVGDRYGYRAHGPFEPAQGHRFAPAKLLVDPYARLVSGRVDYSGPVNGHSLTNAAIRDERDSAPFVPRSVVTDVAPLGPVARPHVPWLDTVLYELHVKGFTQLMPDVPAPIRGTYLGLGSDAAIAYLKGLGITTVELLPIHEWVDESRLVARGLTNFWGYNSLGYFAPSQRFAFEPDSAVEEFRTMVRALHGAGIEVILDVVYNHTCEGDETGPTLSFRGLDNATYYDLEPNDPARYVNRAACGNTLRIEHPQVLRLVMDSLRYWMSEMGVDGFRFDLASILGREQGRFDRGAAFFDVLHQDPVLRTAKLIAEPWDATGDGFMLGKFPPGFREWNSYYRDDLRRFWNGYERRMGPLATRLSGSSDLFSGRGPLDSINFVTCHDGFTLRDLVSFEARHNERNGENNEDGSRDNLSANFGVEGPTEERAVTEARSRQMRNFLTTLLLTPGVPMLLAGDESGRSQRGNNNAYCLDDPTSWLPWLVDETGRELSSFTRGLLALRRELPALRRSTHFTGQSSSRGADPDARWFRPDGQPMHAHDWDMPEERALLMLIAEESSHLALLVNGGAWALDFHLPPPTRSGASRSPGWQGVVLVDTNQSRVPHGKDLAEGSSVYHLQARSMAVLRLRS